jgi:DNA-binding LacI/PurR family transcriptional regulator
LTLKNEQERLRGYQRALESAGVPLNSALIWKAGLRHEDAEVLCKQKLQSSAKRPTALFATNGVTGMGALRAIVDCGLETPGDIALVTFDELTAEDVFRPSITSVVQPAYDIGFRATEILIQRIMSGSAGERIAIRLPATLKVRESSGRALRGSRSSAGI